MNSIRTISRAFGAPLICRTMLAAGSIAACNGNGQQTDRLVTYASRSAAMAPTIPVDSQVVIREFGVPSTGAGRVKRGDIVEYAWPHDSAKKFIHRIVGLPGDTLAMEHGSLKVNGHEYAEPYAWRAGDGTDTVSSDFNWQKDYAIKSPPDGYSASRIDWGPLLIPPGFFFVLGDNRDNSLDSRYSGLIPLANLRGLVQTK